MAEKEILQIITIHGKPVSDGSANMCPAEKCTNQNAVQHKGNPKYDKITQMFLARPANATADITELNMAKPDVRDRNTEEVKIRKVKEFENKPKVDEEEQKLKAKYEAIEQMFLARPANATTVISEVNTPKQDAPEVKVKKAKEFNVSPQENGPKDDVEEQKLKEKYEAIAQMFLARPAPQQDQIGEGTNIKKRVKRRDESARDLYDTDRSARAKRVKKDDKKIGKEDKQSKPSGLTGCFSFIVEWFSKKKQKRQDKKMKTKASKNRKGKSVRFCELPPDIQIYDSDECVDTDARDVCKVDDVDIFII